MITWRNFVFVTADFLPDMMDMQKRNVENQLPDTYNTDSLSSCLCVFDNSEYLFSGAPHTLSFFPEEHWATM